MKIKEVAARTGLTEKAIRFYESKRLITPQTYELGGRTFREYTEENVRHLTEIAALRRAFFSVGQISELMLSPEKTGEIFAAYRTSLCTDYANMTPLVEQLEAVEPQTLRGIGDIAALFTDKTPPSTPPRELRCSPLDELPSGEREEAYRSFLRRQLWRDRRDACLSVLSRICKWVAVLVCALAVLYVLYFVLTNIRILRDVTVTVDAIEWQEGQPDSARPCTLTLSGEIRDYLFRTDIARLSVTLSEYTPSEDYGAPRLSLTRPHGTDAWRASPGSLFDALYTTDGPIYCAMDWWMDEAAGVAYFLLAENTGTGMYTYDTKSRSHVITVGVKTVEEAQTLLDFVRLTERTGYEKRMAERYGKE